MREEYLRQRKPSGRNQDGLWRDNKKAKGTAAQWTRGKGKKWVRGGQEPWHVALVGHGRAVDVIPIAIGNYWTFLSWKVMRLDWCFKWSLWCYVENRVWELSMERGTEHAQKSGDQAEAAAVVWVSSGGGWEQIAESAWIWAKATPSHTA